MISYCLQNWPARWTTFWLRKQIFRARLPGLYVNMVFCSTPVSNLQGPRVSITVLIIKHRDSTRVFTQWDHSTIPTFLSWEPLLYLVPLDRTVVCELLRVSPFIFYWKYRELKHRINAKFYLVIYWKNLSLNAFFLFFFKNIKFGKITDYLHYNPKQVWKHTGIS